MKIIAILELIIDIIKNTRDFGKITSKLVSACFDERLKISEIGKLFAFVTVYSSFECRNIQWELSTFVREKYTQQVWMQIKVKSQNFQNVWKNANSDFFSNEIVGY